jgi:Type IIA topoisomerase (DNA gyrase/topo II, topoisomerase IV), A subunit
MTDRTGLGPLELAVLRSVSATAGSSGRHCRTTKTLEYLDSVESIGPAYLLPVLKDLGSSWRVHLPLLDLLGNWGSVFGDPMADPQYTEVRLSPIGELALLCEEYAVGPVPIGLVNGSLYRGGQAPPLDPARALQTVGALIEDDLIPDGDLERLIGLPLLPTGGTVQGDLEGLYAGRSSVLLQSCPITREQIHQRQVLVITGTPLGVAVNEIGSNLGEKGLNPLHNLPGPLGLLDVRDESSGRKGIRLILVPAADADLDALERWVRGVWPVTIETNCRFRGGIDEVLRIWANNCRVDRSGLDKLTALTS